MLSRIYKLIIPLLLFLGASSGTTFAASEFRVDGEYWAPRLSGEVKNGSTLQPHQDLGLDRSALGSLKFSLKKENGPRYFIRYEAPSFSSTAALTHSVSLGGITHNAGDQVAAELNVKHWQIGVQEEKPFPSGKFSVIYSYHHNFVETTLQNTSQQITSRERHSGDAVSVGFAWETQHARGLNYFAEATPLSIGRNASYQDYNIGIKSKIGKALTLTTGYRGEKLSAGQQSDSIGSRLHLRGWYIFLAAEQ
ncbi:hypothetical protein [Azotosporobacter soli]|uniref:hypothetical protein n=1 Tax=Azotosporobacter soli TaxID=3055040 RepID=UPI0031FEC5AD